MTIGFRQLSFVQRLSEQLRGEKEREIDKEKERQIDRYIGREMWLWAV